MRTTTIRRYLAFPAASTPPPAAAPGPTLVHQIAPVPGRPPRRRDHRQGYRPGLPPRARQAGECRRESQNTHATWHFAPRCAQGAQNTTLLPPRCETVAGWPLARFWAVFGRAGGGHRQGCYPLVQYRSAGKCGAVGPEGIRAYLPGRFPSLEGSPWHQVFAREDCLLGRVSLSSVPGDGPDNRGPGCSQVARPPGQRP